MCVSVCVWVRASVVRAVYFLLFHGPLPSTTQVNRYAPQKCVVVYEHDATRHRKKQTVTRMPARNRLYDGIRIGG